MTDSPTSTFRLRTLWGLCLILLISGCGPGQLIVHHDGEMVYYGQTSRIRSLDPVKAGDVASSMGIGKIYEGLLEYAYLDRPYHVAPCLAEAMPDVSDDGLVYTFRIRRGIHFQDDPCFKETGGQGREVTAHDFVYSIKRVADVKLESTGYWAFNERIVGLDEFRAASMSEEPTDYDADVEGLQALDSHTFQITLTRPYPQLLWILAMHYAFVVPREAAEFYGKEFGNKPVGTGPYRLKSWRRNYRIEFERNPKWAETGRVELYPSTGEDKDAERGLLDDAGQPIPFIDRIVQYVVSDMSTQWLMFLTGQFYVSGISRDNWDVVLTEDRTLSPEIQEKDIRMEVSPSLTLFYFGFNMEDEVVGGEENKKLRQAMTSAFNTAEWERFYNYRVQRPTGPIPPGLAGYVDQPARYPFDLDRARALLAEAGYPDGRDPKTGRRLQLTLELGSAENPEIRQSTELFINFMDQIGIVVTPSYNNWPTFLDKIQRGQAQMFSLGWVADYPDAENFLQLFYGPNRSPGPNHAHYRNAEFDRLYEKVRVMQDTPERTALYERMADIVVEDSPWIFSATPLDYGLFHSWVKNFKNHDFSYTMIKYYKVDMNIRRAWLERYGG